jgi:hypothetical protein
VIRFPWATRKAFCEYKALANSLNIDLSFDPVADARVSDEVG